MTTPHDDQEQGNERFPSSVIPNRGHPHIARNALAIGLTLLGPTALSFVDRSGSAKAVDSHMAFFNRGAPVRPEVHNDAPDIDVSERRDGIVASSVYGLFCRVRNLSSNSKNPNYQPVSGEFTGSDNPAQFELLPNTASTVSGLVDYDKADGQEYSSVDDNALRVTVKKVGDAALVGLTGDLTHAVSQTSTFQIEPGQYIAGRDGWIDYMITDQAGKLSFTTGCNLEVIKADAGEVPFTSLTDPNNIVEFGKL